MVEALNSSWFLSSETSPCLERVEKVQLMASNKKSLATVERFPSRAPNAPPADQPIQSVIRKRIDSGQLQPSDPVPSERDLAKTHHVSLMTARHGLAFLEREGLVERHRGIDTFVAPPRIHFNKLMSYTEHMAARTLTAGAKVLFAEIVDNENEAAARLSLPPNSKTIELERLRHASGEPFTLETCYLHTVEFPGLLCAPVARESLFGILERDYKVEPGDGQDGNLATAPLSG